eukprot:scaffold223157_cov30-Tisochrysis_lutea.AAC.1
MTACLGGACTSASPAVDTSGGSDTTAVAALEMAGCGCCSGESEQRNGWAKNCSNESRSVASRRSKDKSRAQQDGERCAGSSTSFSSICFRSCRRGEDRANAVGLAQGPQPAKGHAQRCPESIGAHLHVVGARERWVGAQDLRCHVERRAAQRLGHISLLHVASKAKVGDLQHGVRHCRGEEQVLWLEVSVYQVVIAQVAQSLRELSQIVARLRLCLRPFRTDDTHEVSSGAELHDKVDMPLCGLHVVEADDLLVESRPHDRLNGEAAVALAVLAAVDHRKGALACERRRRGRRGR